MGEREADLGVVELLSGGAAGVLGSDLLHVHDLHAGEASTVASSHVTVQLVDGTIARGVAELLVKVVGTGTRVIAEEDTEVLDLQRLALEDLSPT